MMDMLILVLAASGTALATGIGAVPVFMLDGKRAERFEPFMLGLAAGVMGVASFVGLLIPGFRNGGNGEVVAGFLVGLLFLIFMRKKVNSLDPLAVFGTREDSRNHSRSLLVFAVLFVHSLPEGFAVGTAYASDSAKLGLFVILAIALQNIPEGTSMAIPMHAAGYSRQKQFWASVGTSLPQPLGAVISFLLVKEIAGLLPFSFGFAGGAMLTLVVFELLPDMWKGSIKQGITGLLLGAAVMFALDVALGV